MTYSRKNDQRVGASTGDMLVLLAILTLALAVAYPRLRERAFERQLDGAVSMIEALREASSAFEDQDRQWPAPSPPGVTPPELASTFPTEHDLAAEGYTLEWNRWETVDRSRAPESSAPAPSAPTQQDSRADSVTSVPTTRFRTMGGVTVYSGDSALLAGLLEHYGTSLSFVRDTIWTLMIPR